MQRNTFTLHKFSFPTNFSESEESIALFLITLGTVLILWILICCIWFIRCRHDEEQCVWLSYQSYLKDNKFNHNLLSKKSNSMIADNICLHANPFETNHISSLRTTRFVR
jgi:hypothetical protein